MNEFKWRYSLSGHGTRQGINRAATEGFAGDRIGSLTREICQNSLDAKDLSKNNEPVIIQFKEFKIRNTQFPDLKNYSKSLSNLYKEVDKLTDKKGREIVQNSIDIMSNRDISFLRISDFNTLGLEGVKSKNNTPWNNLVRSEGVSDKDSNAGGSFGIGKNASFATSYLNTVFYSTYNKMGEKATIGVANFASYDVEDKNDYTQGTEYLSINDYKEPYEGLINLDKSFERKEFGTDIYVAGFIQYDNNEQEIIKSILNNYLYAIYDESLIVEVNDVVINKNNLEKLLDYYKDKDVLEQTTFEIYNLLISEDVLIYKKKVLEKDDIEIRIIMDPNGSRNMSMIRKPWMRVMTQVGYRRHYTFYGLCLIKGNKLNALLRKAENPQHDKWEPNRIIGSEKIVSDNLKKIQDHIRTILEELHEIEDVDALDIFGAAEYIPMDTSGSFKIQEKVEEKMLDVEIKISDTQVDNELINEYEEEGNFIIDMDGNIEIEIPSQPVNEESKTDNKNDSKMTIFTGEKVGIAKKSLRIISSGIIGNYIIVIDMPKEYPTTNIKINALDEQGKVISDVIKISEGIINNKKFDSYNNILLNVPLINGRNIINIKTNLKLKLGLGVEINEVKR